MDYRKSKAPSNTVTRDVQELWKETGNIYESVAIIAKRANQISVEIKQDLSKKLAEFASYNDSLDEVFENREQIEISRYYEKLPKPTLLATQEKQPVFLFLALLVTIACLCLPVGSFEPKGMGTENQLMNLWLSDADGGKNFNVWALFAILLVTCPMDLFAIFDYHNRRRQARFCMFSMLMIAGWYIVYGVFSQVLMTGFTFHVTFAACLPLVAFILLWLARHAILADEALVRAADRIR